MENISQTINKLNTRLSNWPRQPRSTGETPAGSDPCPRCGGLGFYSLNVPIGDPRFGKLLPCECRAADRSARLQKICGLTDSERQARLSDVIETGPSAASLLSAARSFVSEPFGLLTLWGGVGNAKTLILQSIVNECIEQNRLAIYVTMFDLVSNVREAFNAGEGTSAYRRLMQFADAEILAIDEMDKIKDSAWTLELQTALFDRRYRDGLAHKTGTLLAMNTNPDRLPDWIYSRLSDGRNRIVHSSDQDMRPILK